MTTFDLLRFACRPTLLGAWMAVAPFTVAAAPSGPPIGRVHESARQEDVAAPAEPAPVPAPAPARPPADGPAAAPVPVEGAVAPPVPGPATPGTPAPPPASTPPATADDAAADDAATEDTSAAPAAAAPSTQPPSEQAPLKERPARPRLPIFQRADQPVETTVIPGERAPQTMLPPANHELVYVPGFRSILTGHRGNYFISGVSSAQHAVKFQYSFKFDLWPNASRHSAYFGFTQKSLWRLWDFSASSPFEESNYAPEIFYGYYAKVGDVLPAPGRATYFLDHARAGLEHESNGLDGMASRGWNRLSASARLGAYLGVDHYFSVTPTAWAPPFGASENADIAQYLGYGSLGVEYGYDPAVRHWWGGFSLGATAWKGANPQLERRAVEIAAQWRPGYEGKFVEWWKFTPYFYAQLHDGYGETLLQYNQRVTAFRIGVALEDRVNWISLPKSRRPDRD